MITYFLIIFFIINEVLEKKISQTALLIFQIIGAFASGVFLFIEKESFDFIGLYANARNEYFVVGALALFSIVKLYEVIGLNNKVPEKIRGPLLILIIFSQSNIYFKLISLVFMFVMKVDIDKYRFKIKRIDMFILFIGLYLSSVDELNIYLSIIFGLIVVICAVCSRTSNMLLVTLSLLNLRLNHLGYISVITCLVIWIDLLIQWDAKSDLIGGENRKIKNFVKKVQFYKSRTFIKELGFNTVGQK